jgi:hypothetical protein
MGSKIAENWFMKFLCLIVILTSTYAIGDEHDLSMGAERKDGPRLQVNEPTAPVNDRFDNGQPVAWKSGNYDATVLRQEGDKVLIQVQPDVIGISGYVSSSYNPDVKKIAAKLSSNMAGKTRWVNKSELEKANLADPMVGTWAKYYGSEYKVTGVSKDLVRIEMDKEYDGYADSTSAHFLGGWPRSAVAVFIDYAHHTVTRNVWVPKTELDTKALSTRILDLVAP